MSWINIGLDKCLAFKDFNNVQIGTATEYLGWSDFWKKNLGTWHVVVDCFGTLNLKFYFDLLLFHLAQDLTKPQKILKKPKKHQNQPKNALFNIFKGFTWNKICSLFYSKAKNEEKLPKFFLYFCLGKIPVSPFLRKKITKNFKFWILFFFNCSLM